MGKDEAHNQEQSQERNSDLVPLGSILGGLFTPEMLAAMAQAQSAPHAQSPLPETPAEQSPKKALEKAPKKAVTISNKLAKAAAEIKARPDKVEAAYMARELVQCTLPHRDPGDVPAWVRRNGNFALVLQPGFDEQTMQPVGLPYGSIPRLLLLWIVTEAVRTKSRHIKLGDTLNDFLREIGLNPRTGGGKRGDATRLKEQMLRLFQCRFSFKYSQGDEEKGSKSFLNMELTREAHFWWDFKNPEQGSLFESELVLGEVFFEAITAHKVPIDFRALRALKQSSFALDIYTWTSYRVFRLQRDGLREVTIPLASLKEQFGTEYSRPNNFKAALLEALEKVQEVFPALDYTLKKDVLILRDSQTKAMPTRAERPRLAQERAQELARQISPKTRTWFAKNRQAYDIETAIADFEYWIGKQNIEPQSYDALFITFVKKHWAR